MPGKLDPPPRRVSLFVTCIVDMVYPETGESVVAILERLGLAVDFPMQQTCCGQPAFNAGFWDEARPLALHFLEVFRDAEVIVCPSGSCATMVSHFYPQLFADDPDKCLEAEALASRTWEFTQFLVDGLGVTDVGARFDGRIAYHDACHMLRELNGAGQPRALLQKVEGAEFVELEGHDECCGFGGLFSVKMADISSAMLQKKVNRIHASDVDLVVTSDSSCLTQMNGGLKRANARQQVVHIADLLAARATSPTQTNDNQGAD